MKFRTEDLIVKIDKILSDDNKAEHLHEAREDRKAREHREKWLKENLDEWEKFGKVVRKAWADREPITNEMVPKTLRKDDYNHDRLSFYREYKPVMYKGVNRERLTQLRAMLEASTDELISSTSLRDMGYRDLGGLFN